MLDVIDIASRRAMTPAASGTMSIHVTDTFTELLRLCKFDNIERTRLEQVFATEHSGAYNSNWAAFGLNDANFGSTDDLMAAAEAPHSFFGARQLLSWDARQYPWSGLDCHRVVALGAKVMEGGVPHFLAINYHHRRGGLKTLSFAEAATLCRLPKTYILRSFAEI
jgi:hypothetical protein